LAAKLKLIDFIKKYEVSLLTCYELVDSIREKCHVWRCMIIRLSRKSTIKIKSDVIPNLGDVLLRLSEYIDVPGLEEFIRKREGWADGREIDKGILKEWRVRRAYLVRMEKLFGIEGAQELSSLHREIKEG